MSKLLKRSFFPLTPSPKLLINSSSKKIINFLKDETGSIRLPSRKIPIAEISQVAREIISKKNLPTKPPKMLIAFPEASKVKPKNNVQGGGVSRKRWQDKNAIYEWDSRHGYVEKYDKRGNHQGKFDASTGVEIKGPNPRKFIYK